MIFVGFTRSPLFLPEPLPLFKKKHPRINKFYLFFFLPLKLKKQLLNLISTEISQIIALDLDLRRILHFQVGITYLESKFSCDKIYEEEAILRGKSGGLKSHKLFILKLICRESKFV